MTKPFKVDVSLLRNQLTELEKQNPSEDNMLLTGLEWMISAMIGELEINKKVIVEAYHGEEHRDG